MEFAIELNSRQLVSAKDGNRYARYKCPVCGSGTVFRKGGIKTPHFAHRKNSADPECENYHPSPDQWDYERQAGGKDASPIGRANSIELAQLCVIVEDRSQIRSKQTRASRWELRVLLPRSSDGIGTMSYDFGRFPPRQIHMSKLAKGGAGTRDFSANPATPRFEPRTVSSETCLAFRESVSTAVPGLDHEGLTAFECRDERLKPRVRQLKWGNRYYFVWKRDLHLSIPKSLEVEPLLDSEGFSCALLDLPEYPDSNTQEWLKVNCSCDIGRHGNRLSSLYPFLTTPNPDGGFDVPVREDFLLGASERNGDTCVHIIASSGTQVDSRLVDLSPNSRTVLEFKCRQGAPTKIQVDGSFARNFRLCPPISPQQIESSFAVQIEIGTARGRSVKVGLHTSNARSWLEKVRNGCAELTGISFPACAVGKLGRRQSMACPWEEIQISSAIREGRPSTSLTRLEGKDIAEVQEYLRLTTCDVKLSFGAFGEHEFRAKDVKLETRIYLPRALRDRILWLCRESSFTHRAPPQTIQESIADQDLVSLFRSVTPPINLEPHYRSVARQLDGLTSALRLGA